MFSKELSGKSVRTILGIAFLIGIGILIYFPVGGHTYSVYDDMAYIVLNERIQGGLTFEGFKWAFTEYRYMNNWHPLTWLSYMTDISLFGVSPEAQHWINVGFHITNSMLMIPLAWHFTRHGVASFLVALLFLIHPLHVESVAWIAERKDVLSGFFFLLGLLAYFYYASRPSIKRYVLVTILFLMGLLSKPMVVTFPLILLLIDYWPLNRYIKGNERLRIIRAGRFTPIISLVVEKLPLFILSLASGLITILAQGNAINSFDSVRFSFRILNAVVSYGEYLVATLAPISLAAYYPIDSLDIVGEVIPYSLCLAGVTLIAVFRIRKNPEIIVGWLWFLVMLLPVIGLLQVGSQSRADRYMYLPSIGLFLIVGVMISRWTAEQLKRRPLYIFPVMGLYFFLSCIQVGYWGNPVALQLQALENGGDSLQTRLNLAATYLKMNMLEEAEEHAKKAIELSPGNGTAHMTRGMVYFNLGDFSSAEPYLLKASQLDQDNFLILNNLGAVTWKLGKYEEAKQIFLQAYKLNPDFILINNNLKEIGVDPLNDL